MKTLTQLSGILEEREWRDTHGILQSVHVEAAPGFFVRVTLGGAGLVVRNTSGAAVAVPLAEILSLANRYEPGLLPAADKLNLQNPV